MGGCLATDRVHSMRLEVIVSLCQSTPAVGGTLARSSGWGTQLGGEPTQGTPLARSEWRGTPARGCLPSVPTDQVRMGGTPARGHLPRVPPRPGQDVGYNSQGCSLGVPPGRGTPRDRTSHGVLDTPRSVCLMRSRRRTFLYYICSLT